MEETFTNKYEQCIWANNGNPHYKGGSGGGSELPEVGNTYIPFLKRYIRENEIRTVVDLGCGDFQCGNQTYDELDITYTGYDVYKKVITYNQGQHPAPKYQFVHSDFYTEHDAIVGGDLCILKDVLQHWTVERIYTFLDALVASKKFKHILLINCCDQSRDDPISQLGNTMQLHTNYLPLKKYNPVELYRYSTKQVSVIRAQ